MGRLYEYSKMIQDDIERRDLDVFKTRGELAMKCGFIITLIGPDDPDDPAKIAALQAAARDVLGLNL
ncbi:MAG: hypothetical protein ACYC6C_09115 [Coriobacteriia bacterium]